MRSVFLLLLIAPLFVSAQINRSAKELASEKIQEYIETKLFKNKSYKAVAYGELKAVDEKNSRIAWTITHKFEIAGDSPAAQQSGKQPKAYKFLFFLDEKMEVVRADTYYAN